MATPSMRSEEDWKALARVNGTSRRASGWAGEKVARSKGQSGYPLVEIPYALVRGRSKRRKRPLNAKGLTALRQEIPRRVIGTENQNSASYADQSKYC